PVPHDESLAPHTPYRSNRFDLTQNASVGATAWICPCLLICRQKDELNRYVPHLIFLAPDKFWQYCPLLHRSNTCPLESFTGATRAPRRPGAGHGEPPSR